MPSDAPSSAEQRVRHGDPGDALDAIERPGASNPGATGSAVREGQVRERQASFHMPPTAFAIAVGALFFFLLLLESLWIVRVTYGPVSATDGGEPGRWIWNLLTLFVLSWAMLNLAWAIPALRRLRFATAAAHLGFVLCCGVAALGLQALIAARTLNDAPIVLDYTHLARPPAAPVAAATAATAVGDAVEGKKLFAMTCITCHGPAGDGLNNLAPSLRASEFIKASDAKAITRVVKLGRGLTDPNNKSGKMMPAKGGNPFLTDLQIAHLVAFIKQLPESAPSPAAAAASTTQVPAAQLSRWVLPTATSPPVGFVALEPGRDRVGIGANNAADQKRRNQLVQNLSLAAVAVHGGFVLGVLGYSMFWVFGWLLGIRQYGRRSRLVLISWGWVIAAAVWLVIVLLFRGA